MPPIGGPSLICGICVQYHQVEPWTDPGVSSHIRSTVHTGVDVSVNDYLYILPVMKRPGITVECCDWLRPLRHRKYTVLLLNTHVKTVVKFCFHGKMHTTPHGGRLRSYTRGDTSLIQQQLFAQRVDRLTIPSETAATVRYVCACVYVCVYVCVHNVHRRQSIQNAIWQWRLTLSALHPRVSNQNRQIKRSRSLHKPNITISKHTHTHTRVKQTLCENTLIAVCACQSNFFFPPLFI